MPRWRWITVVAVWIAALIVWPVIAVVAYASGHSTFTHEGVTASGGAAEGFLPFALLVTLAGALTVALLWFAPSSVQGRNPGTATALLVGWGAAIVGAALVSYLLASFIGFVVTYSLLG